MKFMQKKNDKIVHRTLKFMMFVCIGSRIGITLFFTGHSFIITLKKIKKTTISYRKKELLSGYLKLLFNYDLLLQHQTIIFKNFVLKVNHKY